jgi:hypothetical protein
MAIGPQSYHPVKAWPTRRNPVTFRTDIAKMDKGRSLRPLGNAGSGWLFGTLNFDGNSKRNASRAH